MKYGSGTRLFTFEYLKNRQSNLEICQKEGRGEKTTACKLEFFIIRTVASGNTFFSNEGTCKVKKKCKAKIYTSAYNFQKPPEKQRRRINSTWHINL